jgi:hypothetical protein
MRKHIRPEVVRITGARVGLSEDVRGRQRRYIISMSVRTVSFILFVSLWNVSRPVGWIALVLGLLLPYVAVVIANAGRENAPSLPSSFVSAPLRPMLERGKEKAENLPADPGTEEQPSPRTGQT